MNLTTNQEEELNAIIEKMGDELNESQIRAVPLIAFGMPASKVSKIIKVEAATIRQWIRTDRAFRWALSEFQKYTDLYHVAMLNQAASVAWDRIFEFLETEYPDEDKTGRINQAQTARFVITELGIMKNKKEDEQEAEVQLHITESSADLIARRVAEIQQKDEKTVEQSEYKVSESSTDLREIYNSMDAAKEFGNTQDEIKAAESGPQYPHHPYTKIGEMTLNEDGRMCCHICGEYPIDMVLHLRNVHKISPIRYREMYKIPDEIKFGTTKPVPATSVEIEAYNRLLDEENNEIQE